MALAVLAVLAVVAGCYLAAPVVLPALVALFMAMLLAPVARRLTRWVGRGWASFLAVTLALGAVFLGGFGVYRSIAGIVQETPLYRSKVKRAVETVEERLAHLRTTAQKVVPAGAAGGEAPGQGGGGQAAAPGQAGGAGGKAESALPAVLLRGLGTLVEAAGLALFVPFLALFFLMEEEPLSRALDRALGPDYDGPRLRRDAPRMARAYVYGNAVLALALAVIQGGLFAAFGLDNAVGLGLVTGFLNVIPILGVPVAIALPLLQGLGSFHGPTPPAVIGGTILALHLFSANWIIPRWIGVHVKVNSTAATFAMLFFSWLWGLTGFLLAVPLAAVIKIALECSPRSRALAPLLAAPEGEERPAGS
jgi:predicted PurR-regulated permease PerM